jgi:LPXTG-motif cell wall-anchored protein
MGAFLVCGVAIAEQEKAIKHVTGTIVSVSDDELVLRTANAGEETFHFKEGASLPANLHVGDRVDLTYEDGWTNDMVVTVNASTGSAHMDVAKADDRYGMDSTRPMSASASPKLKGTIVSVTSDQIVIRTPMGERKTLVRETGFEFPGDLKQGNQVEVQYFDRNGQLVATNVVNVPDSAMAETRSTLNERLPQTASFLPLFGLAGLLSLGAASVLHRMRRR